MNKKIPPGLSQNPATRDWGTGFAGVWNSQPVPGPQQKPGSNPAGSAYPWKSLQVIAWKFSSESESRLTLVSFHPRPTFNIQYSNVQRSWPKFLLKGPTKASMWVMFQLLWQNELAYRPDFSSNDRLFCILGLHAPLGKREVPVSYFFCIQESTASSGAGDWIGSGSPHRSKDEHVQYLKSVIIFFHYCYEIYIYPYYMNLNKWEVLTINSERLSQGSKSSKSLGLGLVRGLANQISGNQQTRCWVTLALLDIRNLLTHDVKFTDGQITDFQCQAVWLCIP